MADARIRDLDVQGSILTTMTFPADDPTFAKARSVAGSIFDGRYLLESNNLSDLDNAATARTNLGVAIGSDVQAWDATLDAFAAYNTNGLITQTAADTFTGRTITQPAAGITVADGDGVAGNPTLALANDLSALEGLGGTGIAVRSAADTWVQRTITGTANQVDVTNGDGVAGNPTLATPQNIDTTATPEFDGMTISSTDGIDYNPGSDADTDIITVGVTGTPIMIWDESEDKFSINKGFRVTDGEVQIETNNSTDAIRTRESTNRVGITNSNPQARLDIYQFSATGAVPVLQLIQDDVDYVLMKIQASAAAASADRTLVADSDYGTPGALTGWIQVEIQDDGNRIADGDYYIPFYAVPT